MKEIVQKEEEEKSEILWKIHGESKKYTSAEVFDKIKTLSEKAKENGYGSSISIGTDSQMCKGGYQFITAICHYTHGKGGLYFYRPEFIQNSHFNKNNKKARMFEEANRSIELANLLFEETSLPAEIHLDASHANKKVFTSDIVEQLKGYVVSCGYEVKIKPDSYMASAIADRHSKKIVL